MRLIVVAFFDSGTMSVLSRRRCYEDAYLAFWRVITFWIFAEDMTSAGVEVRLECCETRQVTVVVLKSWRSYVICTAKPRTSPAALLYSWNPYILLKPTY